MKYIFEVHIREGYTAEDYADAWVRAYLYYLLRKLCQIFP